MLQPEGLKGVRNSYTFFGGLGLVTLERCLTSQSQKLGESKTMTLHEMIQDIHGLDAELTQLEKRYGLLSADFYHLYKAGELEQSRDFIQWVGYYEAKLAREARYREVMYQHLRELRQQAGLGALHLAPEPAPAGAA